MRTPTMPFSLSSRTTLTITWSAILMATLVGCGGGSSGGDSSPSLLPVDPLKVDTSYGTDGSAKLNGLVPSAAVLQPDGKLLLAGSRQTGSLPAVNYGGAPAQEVIVRRLTANGAPDPSFGNNGEVSFTVKGSDSPADIKLQKNGRIIVAVLAGEPCVVGFLSLYAPCTTAAGTSALRSSNLVALTPEGLLDRTFGQAGVEETYSSQNPQRLSLVVKNDESLLLLRSTGNSRFSIYGRSLDRFSANGVRDTSTPQISPQPPCEADGASLLLQKGGRIISAGGRSLVTYAKPSEHPGLCIAAHDPNSGLQTAGSWTSFGGNYALSSLEPTSDDGFVAVGTNCGDESCQLGIARYRADTERQTSYGQQGLAFMAIPQNSTIASTRVLPDDSVMVLASRAVYDANGKNPTFGSVWMRMSPQGEPVKEFGTQGLLTTPLSAARPTHFVPDAQGRWLVISENRQTAGSNNTVLVQRVVGHSKP
ncbi:putative delta-60 repeat protein [Acidovorax sp. 62]|nr:putative delta-60 repeat protein [Acidovorax sp. 62]